MVVFWGLFLGCVLVGCVLGFDFELCRFESCFRDSFWDLVF